MDDIVQLFRDIGEITIYAIAAVLIVVAIIRIGRSPMTDASKAIWALGAVVIPVLGSLILIAYAPVLGSKAAGLLPSVGALVAMACVPTAGRKKPASP